MKYIIMAGGEYKHWEKPRHLSIINGEEVIARTIRLLKENGIKDIAISTENPIFEKYHLPILKHDNNYTMQWHNMYGDWLDCFYPTDEPVCYILGDVYFSKEAIQTIINTQTNDIELFGSIPPFEKRYIKKHIEAFALKVVNISHFKEALKKTRQLDKEGKFYKKPIVWELWTVIKDLPIQQKGEEYIYNYTKINDYTCDVDWEEDIKKFNEILKEEKEMVRCEVIENFTLERYNELKNIKRKGIDKPGKLLIGDTFECERELADYLMGHNAKNKTVVKVIEIIPEAVVTEKVEEPIKEEKKTTKKSIKKNKRK